MTKPALHTVIGARGKRKSPRVYTHAVVGHWDFDAELKRAPDYVRSTMDHKYFVRNASANVGDPYPGYSFKVDQQMVDAGREYVAKYSADEKVAYERKLAEKVEQIKHAKGASLPEPMVLQWSMTERSALKAVGTFEKRGYRDVSVMPVVRIP